MSWSQKNPPTTPRPDPPAGSLTARWDRDTERRHAALDLALRWNIGAGGGKSASAVTEAAEVFLKFMTDKS